MSRLTSSRYLYLAFLITCIGGGAAFAMDASAMVFEDVNNNGVFDPGVDKDRTHELDMESVISSTEVIVVSGETFKARKSTCKSTGDCPTINIFTTKDIHINANLDAGVWGSFVTVSAGGSLTIASNVRITGMMFVDLAAAKEVVVGDNVDLKSSGLCDHLWAEVNLSGSSIEIGSNVSMYGRRQINLHATSGISNGEVSVGPGLALKTSDEEISIVGSTVTLNGAKLTGPGIQVWGSAVELRSGKVTVVKLGSDWVESLIHSDGTLDVRGTVFKVPKPAPEGSFLVLDGEPLLQ